MSHPSWLIAVALLLPLALAHADDPSRIAVRDGAFVESPSGAAFTPLGVNYFRVGKVDGGRDVHATFCPGFYDRAFVEKMMADLARWRMNTVRTFQVYHVGPSGILTSPQSREINPAYLANVVHFLEQARAHGIHVIFSWDIWNPPSDWWSSTPLPDEAKYDLRPWQEELGINNFHLCREWVRTRANSIVALIDALRSEDPSLLRVVMAWELENESCFEADQPPFKDRAGTFRFAGKDYSLASDDETQALMDAMIVLWADVCAGAIHRADPDALVSGSAFTFAAVGRGGPGTLSRDKTADARIPARPMALLRSRLDYVDVHLYAWKTATETVTQNLDRNLASVEWLDLQTRAREAGKPVLCGECGVFANYLRSAPNWENIDHDLGARCFREHVEGLKAHGLAGALYWAYGNPDSTSGDENPALTYHPQYGQILREAWPTLP